MEDQRIKVQLLSFMSLAHFIHHVELYLFPAMIILISEDIQISYLEIGFLGTVPVLIMALTSPIIGLIASKRDYGFYIVLFGIFIFACSNFVFGLANTTLDLFIGNLLLGVGCTTFHPVGLGVIANIFNSDYRGKALAINHASGVIGTAISPIMSISLTVFIFREWYLMFHILSFFCFLLVFFMLTWMFKQGFMKYYIDFRQNEIVNETRLMNENLKNPRKKVPFGWFIIVITFILTISSLRSGVYRSISYFTTTFMKDFYKVTSLQAGILTSVILTSGSITDVYGAVISDRSGILARIKIVIISGITTILSIFILILVTLEEATIFIILLGFILFAASFYLAGGTLQALQGEIISSKQRTFFYSIVFSLGLVISSISPTIIGGLLDFFNSPVEPLLFLSGLMGLSLVFALLLFLQMKKGSGLII